MVHAQVKRKKEVQTANTNKQVVLDNGNMAVTVELAGSAISSVTLKKGPINPLSWALTPEEMPAAMRGGPTFKGHFLCIGRWGSPSKAEMARGIPHNGEVNTRDWVLIRRPDTAKAKQYFEAVCNLPLDYYHVTRYMRLDPAATVFLVQERVKNLANIGRVFNMVQHPTLGPPFLNAKTVVDCNAGLGFDQRHPYDSLDYFAFRWPNAKLPDGPANLRLSGDERGYVTTHIFDEGVEYGWITALDPISNKLYGYVWKTAQFPWLNVWHYAKNGGPYARGLEFGTTGLGKPYELLVKENVRFQGKLMYEWMEPDQEVTKNYIGFMMEVPPGFAGVETVTVNSGGITLQERGSKRKVSIATALGTEL